MTHQNLTAGNCFEVFLATLLETLNQQLGR